MIRMSEVEKQTRISDLEKRVELLEKEVRLFRSQIRTTTQPVQQIEMRQQKPEQIKKKRESVSIQPQPSIQLGKSQLEAKNKKELDLEHLIGKVWLPRIFIFVLLIGVIWGFKAAVEGGYLNEQVRVIIGFVASGAFLFFGERETKKSRNALGHVLLAGSVAVLILTTFAMHMLYGFIPTTFAFMLNVIWLALGMYLSHRHQSQPLAVLSAIVGVLVPFLVKSVSPNIVFLVGYEVILYSLFLMYAIRKRYLVLYYTSAVLLQIILLITYLLVGHIRVANEEKVWVIGALVQHLLLLATYHYSNHFMKHQMGLLFATFIATIFWFQSMISIDGYGLILLGFFLLYVILSALYWERKKDKQPVFLSLATFSLLLFFMSTLEYSEWLPPILMLQGIVAIYIGLKTLSRLQLLSGLLVYIIGAFSALYLLIEGIQSVFSIGSFTWIIGLGTLYTLNWLIREHKQKFNKLFDWNIDEPVLNAVFYLLIALGSLIFITNVSYVATENWTLQARHITASVVWIVYAGIGLIVGVMRQYKPLRISAIVLVFMTLMKVVIIDLPDLSIPTRAALFIGLGAVGLVMSRIFYKK